MYFAVKLATFLRTTSLSNIWERLLLILKQLICVNWKELTEFFCTLTKSSLTMTWKFDSQPIEKRKCYWSLPVRILVNKTLDQRYFNVVDQHWNNVDPTLKNVDPTLKTKQNPASVFQRYTMLIQRRIPTLKQRRNNVAQRWYNFVSTLF